MGFLLRGFGSGGRRLMSCMLTSISAGSCRGTGKGDCGNGEDCLVYSSCSMGGASSHLTVFITGNGKEEGAEYALGTGALL